MKTLQQELIDFCKWQDKEIRVNRLPEWERLVNAYLKSINSNSAGERRAIGSNEQKENNSRCINYECMFNSALYDECCFPLHCPDREL